MNQDKIKNLSSTGRHHECLQVCKQLLQIDPSNPSHWKYKGKSLIALGQLEKGQQCLVKAYQLDKTDAEIARDIGSTYLAIGGRDTAIEWYKISLEINNNYAPAINDLANLQKQIGNIQEASILFRRATKADPLLVQAYIGAAASLLELGDIDQAEEYATQAIKINEHFSGVNEIIGAIYQNKGNSEQAIKSYKKELAINPKSSTSLLNIGILLFNHGNVLEAFEALSRAEAIKPTKQCALILAQAYQSIGQLNEAIDEYKKLDISTSQNKLIPFNLGLCWLNVGNNLDAIEAFKIAIKLDESFLPAWGNIGVALMNEGRYQEALLATQKVLELDPHDHTANINLSSIYKKLGNLDKALVYALKSLRFQPNNATIHLNLGILYKDLGNLDQALASTLKSLELKPDNPSALMNMGSLYKDLGSLEKALASTRKSLELKPDNPDAQMNLSGIYQELGNLDQALDSTLKYIKLNPNDSNAFMRLGIIYKNLGNLDQALASTLKSIELKPENPDAHINLGFIYKDLGNLDQAFASTINSLKLNPNNFSALMNLGMIYKDLGKLDQAFASTLKSIELKPDNPDAHINLGIIYMDLGNPDQALASTLKCLELKPDNKAIIENLRAIIYQLDFSTSSSNNLIAAYNIFLGRQDVSHKKLSKIFLQMFLPLIRKASASHSIISDSNEAFKQLASDWRFLRSLTLMIPLSLETERFFTRLRKELLTEIIENGAVPQQLKPLTECLAAQCFLNEYVYASSQEEEDSVAKLIDAAANTQEACNRYLAILGCYRSIHTTGICQELIINYPALDESSKELIEVQFNEPLQEQEIKASLQEKPNVTDTISQHVQEMYEENPYPRFKYTDYIENDSAIPIYKIIDNEATKGNLPFSEDLKSWNATPKILIAGCGTGNQVVNASRYKNATITAIDLSSSCLAYAIRKTREYKMKNVTFKQIDLLTTARLGDIYDIIECGGVLHHMDNPSDGLSALIQQLKPGGYIKLGLYSEIARSVILEARKIIQTLGLSATPGNIRDFRKKVIDGEIDILTNLPKFAGDFYSLSEFRDLCFHVQEHCFSTESLERLLDFHGLTFCGFMLPEEITKLYQEQYPLDAEMTSLVNWGKFEEAQPLTFVGMYQFWAYRQM